MSNLTTFTPEKREKFLIALGSGASVTRAAVIAGWSRQSAYNYRKDDEEFAAEWDEAVEEGTDLLEDEARRRATEGLVQYKFDKHGDPLQNPVTGGPYFERQYSDTLLIVLLKSRRPNKYRDNTRHEITGKNGGKIEAVIEATVTDYRQAASALAPPDGSPPDEAPSEMLAPEK